MVAEALVHAPERHDMQPVDLGECVMKMSERTPGGSVSKLPTHLGERLLPVRLDLDDKGM